LEHNDTHNNYQSPYGRGISAEAAILKVLNDVAVSFDEGFLAALIMLDLSTAFDVTEHSILKRLYFFSFGIKEKALIWVSSYLFDRTQYLSPDKGNQSCVSGYHRCSSSYEKILSRILFWPIPIMK